MSATWDQSRSIIIGRNSQPVAGAMAYFYEANTTTPRTVYQDAGLSTPHAHPVVADAFGRWPRVFMNYGSFRERVITPAGIVLWDDAEITIEEPAVSGGGGGSGWTPDTGFAFWTPVEKTYSGFVRANGRSIGSPASGATERANTDVQALYTALWTYLPDTICAVSGGRGASASSDYSAAKSIRLPDLRGRTAIGNDSMGNSAAGIISATIFALGVSQNGAPGGSVTHTITVGEMPSHNHAGSNTATDGSHTHTYLAPVSEANTGGGIYNSAAAAGAAATTTGTGAHSHTVNVAAQGGGAAHNNVQPSVLGVWYIKL